MKIKYMGKYNGDENSLPSLPHRQGYVPYKEIQDTKKLAIFMNVVAVIIMVVLFGIEIYVYRMDFIEKILTFDLAVLASVLLAIPHEYLHAIWFKKESYVYTNLKQGMLFVVGFEDLTKKRFIWLSLFPNICFGLLPLIVGYLTHNFFLTTLGSTSIAMGAGDYYNVFNCLTQVPKGALTYLYGFHSFWYMPKSK